MNNDERLPWDKISIIPNNEINIMAARGPKHLKVFWGKNASEECLLLIELEGDYKENFDKKNIKISGIDIQLRRINNRSPGLVIKVENKKDLVKFYWLCNSLIKTITNLSNTTETINVILEHIKSWQKFLSSETENGIMKKNEIQGLFAELLFFKEMLSSSGLSIDGALDAWIGRDPESGHQDFIYHNTALDVKSILANARSTISISSEDQLETTQDNLFIRTYRLNDKDDGVGAKSLNEIVEEIKDKIQEVGQHKFFLKLLNANYMERTEYDNPKFTILEEKTYRVKGENKSDSFPCIVRSELLPGIQKVRYEIQLEKINTFLCKADEVWR
jgi:hypothetical protein